jgi:hypothetical protein
MRRRLSACLTFIVIMATAAVVSFSSSLHAAASECCVEPPPTSYPERPYKVVSGSGTTSSWGDVIFYNRAVRVQGNVDGYDERDLGIHSCRYVHARTETDERYSPVFCGSGDYLRLDVPANRVGGSNKVVITLYYTGSGQSYAVGQTTVLR